MTTIPLSDAKARLSEIADEVNRTHDRINVTKNGREFVVIVSPDDLESMEATIELLRDSAGQARIAQSEGEIARGETATKGDVVAALALRRDNA